MQRRTLTLGILSLLTVSLLTSSSEALQRKKKTPPPKKPPVSKATPAAPTAGGTKGKVLAAVDAFEKAYQRKDKTTMLTKMMYPTKDKNILNKRYQWLRGYGVDEIPGMVRPPILFTTAPGSYVPTSYKVVKAEPIDAGNWLVVVSEKGSCQEEGKKYAVERVRHITLYLLYGKWYINNYYNTENPDEYGFWVDDIKDKMTEK
jgi:hypothetical protein